jgi:hypothetical protein
MVDLPSSFPQSMLDNSDLPTEMVKIGQPFYDNAHVAAVNEGEMAMLDANVFSITGQPGSVVPQFYQNPNQEIPATDFKQVFGELPPKKNTSEAIESKNLKIQRIEDDDSIDPEADVVIFPNVQTRVTMPSLTKYQNVQDFQGSSGKLIQGKHMIRLINPHHDAMHILKTEADEHFAGGFSTYTMERKSTVHAFATASEWLLV